MNEILVNTNIIPTITLSPRTPYDLAQGGKVPREREEVHIRSILLQIHSLRNGFRTYEYLDFTGVEVVLNGYPRWFSSFSSDDFHFLVLKSDYFNEMIFKQWEKINPYL